MRIRQMATLSFILTLGVCGIGSTLSASAQPAKLPAEISYDYVNGCKRSKYPLDQVAFIQLKGVLDDESLIPYVGDVLTPKDCYQKVMPKKSNQTYGYQWKRRAPYSVSSDIPGATSKSYKVTKADLGYHLSLEISLRQNGQRVKTKERNYAVTASDTSRVREPLPSDAGTKQKPYAFGDEVKIEGIKFKAISYDRYVKSSQFEHDWITIRYTFYYPSHKKLSFTLLDNQGNKCAIGTASNDPDNPTWDENEARCGDGYIPKLLEVKGKNSTNYFKIPTECNHGNPKNEVHWSWIGDKGKCYPYS